MLCETPALFILSDKDKFINSSHSQILHSKYKGESLLNYI